MTLPEPQTDTPRIAVHAKPLRRNQANFLIHAQIQGDPTLKLEQLWCEQLTSRTFRICCVPFFLYDLAIGDEVETSEEYLLSKVLRRSGHVTFRVWLGEVNGREAPDRETRERVFEAISAVGAGIEIYSANLWGVDAPDQRQAAYISGILLQFEQAGAIAYETGDGEAQAKGT